MAKRTIQVDEAEIAAADKRLSDQVDEEVRARLEGSPMDDKTKALIEAADKKATDAVKDASETKKRLEALEACAADSKKLTEAESNAEAAETLRRAAFLAEQRGVPTDRREAEAKRLAAMGRAAVDEVLKATPAPRADPMRLTQRREATAPKRAEHVVRRLESHPDGSGETLVLTVQDWSHYDSNLKADGTPDRHPRPTTGGAA